MAHLVKLLFGNEVGLHIKIIGKTIMKISQNPVGAPSFRDLNTGKIACIVISRIALRPR